MDALELSGARTLNLKGFNVRFPYRSLTVITGCSGSGKTALLLHTLWAASRSLFIPAEQQAELRPALRLLPSVENTAGMLAAVNLSALADSFSARQTVGELCALSPMFSEVIAYHGLPRCAEPDCPLIQGHWKARVAAIQAAIQEKPSRLFFGAFFDVGGLKEEKVREFCRAFLKRGYRRYRIDKQIFRARGFGAEMPVPKNELGVLFDSFAGADFDISRTEEGFRHVEELGSRLLEILVIPAERTAEELEDGKVEWSRYELARGFLCAKCSRTYRRSEGATGRGKGDISGPISSWWQGRPESVWRDLPLHELTRALLKHDPEPRISVLQDKLAVFERLGLGAVRLNQSIAALSSGERLKLAAAFLELSDLTDTLFVCDEPSRVLHPQDLEQLRGWVNRMIALGNSVVVAERSPRWLSSSETLYVLGPGGGEKGGELVFSGPGRDWYVEPPPLVKSEPPQKRKTVKVQVAVLPGAAPREYELPVNAVCALVGRSGSGKSLFLRQLAATLRAEKKAGLPWRKVELVETKKENLRLLLAEAAGLLPHLAKLFAKLPEARRGGLKEKDFLLKNGTGACEACRGSGRASDVEGGDEPCDICGGTRFAARVLAPAFHEMNIAEILSLSVQKALREFSTQRELAAILQSLDNFGLSQLRLDLILEQLSENERARLRLAKILSTPLKSETIFLLDQPFAGMESDKIELCLHQLRRLTAEKATFVCSTHELAAVSGSDYVLEIGMSAELKNFSLAGEFPLDQFSNLGEV